MEQNKYRRMPSGLIDRLQRISSFKNKGASRIICEDIKLLEMLPRMFEVMETLAKYSCSCVRDGRWSFIDLKRL